MAATDWTTMSKLHPDWEECVRDKMGGVSPNIPPGVDINLMRQMSARPETAKVESVLEQDHQISTRDGQSIRCRVYQPTSPISGRSPLVVMCHGGGWATGSVQSMEADCRDMTTKMGFVCVNVDYRLAPEHKLPIPVHDVHDAIKWAVSSASSLGADPSKGFIVGGGSAGANLALAATHLYIDEGTTPPISGSLLAVPVLCHHSAIPDRYRDIYTSWEENKDAPFFTQAAMLMCTDLYTNDASEYATPIFSPFLWSGSHPPTYFQVCGADPLRDEGRIFERMLREEAGVPTKMDVYPGMPHAFSSFPVKGADKFHEDTVEGARWLLGKK